MIRIYQIPVFTVIFVITMIHAHRYAKNLTIGPLFHLVWAAVYGLVVGGICLHYKSWWLLATLLLERFVFYNPLLNYQREPREAFFYLGRSKYAAWWDVIERWWGRAYPYVWGVGAAAYIVINLLFKFW